jgi:predicted transcriptional regulator YheO
MNTKKGLHESDVFSEQDRACLAMFEPLVDSIAKMFGPSCEVVLHSLEDISCSVVKIVNSHVTGRSLGAPMTDFGIKILETAEQDRSDVVGPYITKSGAKMLRSVTVVLRNLSSKPIGCLCINIDLSAPFFDVVRAFLPSTPSDATPAAYGNGSTNSIEHFAGSVTELVRQALEGIVLPAGVDRNRRAIEELGQLGIFKIKGAVDCAADLLGVSKHTVYYYLRELNRDSRSRKI